ncbi:MAG: YceH family protein [Bryobacteraceae bacterium]
MPFQLDPVQARVLGALLEKELATPEYYPLSLNALVNACNQKTNREPVMTLDESAVSQALERLRADKLALILTGRDHRVPKHAHRLYETLNAGTREAALLCVLLLRGPQTGGELRARTQSLHNFEDLDSVQSTLNKLMEREPEPLVARLPRQAGTKEPRYAHLLSGAPLSDAMDLPDAPASVAAPASASGGDRIASLEREVESLRDEIAALRRQFGDFLKQFE